jgi:hypothetical protein
MSTSRQIIPGKERDNMRHLQMPCDPLGSVRPYCNILKSRGGKNINSIGGMPRSMFRVDQAAMHVDELSQNMIHIKAENNNGSLAGSFR